MRSAYPHSSPSRVSPRPQIQMSVADAAISAARSAQAIRRMASGVTAGNNAWCAFRPLAEARAHLTEAPYPLLDRRVRREKARDAAARERLHDVQRLGRLVDLHGHRLRALLQAQERRGEGLRVAADLSAGGVRRVLALPRDRELDEARRDRRQQ